jgi:hypothetical protein
METDATVDLRGVKGRRGLRCPRCGREPVRQLWALNGYGSPMCATCAAGIERPPPEPPRPTQGKLPL